MLDCFGITPDPHAYAIDVPECAYTAGQIIAADLEGHADARYRQVSWLLRWLFSCSGNSSVDYDYEAMAEFQPLAWDKDDLAFAIEIIEEADTIMGDAMAGLAFLTQNPDVLQDLQCNIQDRHNHD